MHAANLETLVLIVEVFFILELIALHLALLMVFVMWLVKHVIHELDGLRDEIRKWRSNVPSNLNREAKPDETYP